MTAPSPTYGTVGSYAVGWVLSRSSWDREGRVWVEVPKRKARGTVVTVWPMVPDVVELLDADDVRTLVRLPHGGAS